MTVNNIRPRAWRWKKCKQIGAPFTVFTTLHHVSLSGRVNAFFLYYIRKTSLGNFDVNEVGTDYNVMI